MGHDIHMLHSSVSRGGVTGSLLSPEPTTCVAIVGNKGDDPIRFRFTLASAGGGTTDVSLRVQNSDFIKILRALAETNPDTAEVFLDCAAVASKKTLETLAQERADTRGLKSQLAPLQDFLSQKYREEPNAEKEEISKLREVLDRVMYTIKRTGH